MSGDINNQNNGENSSFGLPDGYFERSAGSIINKIEWQEEHKEFPRLVAIRDKSVFTLPGEYFSHHATDLELLDFPKLLSLKKDSGFSVPPAYFSEAEVKELASVMNQNSAESDGHTTLASIEKINCFRVSEDYFETNARLLNTLLKPERSARIVDLFFARKAYVAAALLFMCLGLWLYSIYLRPVVESADCGTIACLDKADLVKAGDLENLDNEDLYELVNSGELEKKLEAPKSTEKKFKTDSSSDNLIDYLPEDL